MHLKKISHKFLHEKKKKIEKDTLFYIHNLSADKLKKDLVMKKVI